MANPLVIAAPAMAGGLREPINREPPSAIFVNNFAKYNRTKADAYGVIKRN